MNLVVEALEKLPILHKTESLLVDLYSYFCKSPKKHIEFCKLVEVMETKGLKILRNKKTRWISMLSPTIRAMNEYRTLLVKMLEDSKLKKEKVQAKNATIYLDYLTDIQIVLGLTSILPMLRLSQLFIKFAQKQDAFICDFLAAVQVISGTPFCNLHIP
jgi:hypothetical protein